MDRRAQERCEVCHSPTKYVDGKLLCRNSLCSFNHREIVCPRCGVKGVDAIGYEDGKAKYTCGDCLHVWKNES